MLKLLNSKKIKKNILNLKKVKSVVKRGVRNINNPIKEKKN